MNGNRTKYASVPTFGMNKRGFWKKNPAAGSIQEVPDFSQPSDAPAYVPPQQAAQPMGSVSVPTASQPYGQVNPLPYAQQPFAQQAPVPQQPFAAPSNRPNFAAPAPAAWGQSVQRQPMYPNYAQPAQTPYQPGGYPQQTGAFYGQPMQPQAPVSQPRPAVNAAPVYQPAAPFTRPQAAQAPVQPTAPFPNVNTQQNPFAVSPGQQAFYQQQTAAQPQPAPVPPPEVQKPPKQPLPTSSTLQLVSGSLILGILPMLLIASLFLPASLDFLRYILFILTAAGIGWLWYKKLFSQTIRLVGTLSLCALCIAAGVLMLRSGSDTKAVPTPETSAQTMQMPGFESEDVTADAPAMTPEPGPTPEPEAIGPSEAQIRLALFMDLWKNSDPTSMVELIQPSWRSQQQNPSQALFNLLMNRTAEDYTIEEVGGSDSDSSRTITMRATINKNNGKPTTVYRFMVMMVKEGDEWYVNPNSLATNEDVEEQQEENVVNNKNAGGKVTEPPRTTVTPAPAPATLLYFNNGAHNYHMDPNCAKVASEYLPFDNSFPYSELKSYKNQYNLTPCMACNAPVDALPSDN